MKDPLTVTLSPWERSTLSMHAAAQAVTYLGHYHNAGLFRDEVKTLNAWCDLAAKLDGKPAPEPLAYRGTRRNGFNPEAD